MGRYQDEIDARMSELEKAQEERRIDGLHCGAAFEFYDYGTSAWTLDRLEMDRYGVWYFFNSKLRGTELEQLFVRW